ncbi:hypothetical protein POPTR_005G044333v4 [Populus trichocarpa]|uniref:Uncharacterized protein n=1 Tax=Populus trichocarpa TaxID=3694 RepID=A0A3N7G817_POPTR|nr:hypothetical protein POPTR_005G044333v4 [Populus trichocarpa]
MEKASVKFAFFVALLLIASCLPNEANAREFSIKQQQRQCRVPSDCTSLCHGCTVTQCTAGRCVCNCASTIRSTS